MKILQIKQSAANWQRLCLPLLMLLFACGMLGYNPQASAQTCDGSTGGGSSTVMSVGSTDVPACLLGNGWRYALYNFSHNKPLFIAGTSMYAWVTESTGNGSIYTVSTSPSIFKTGVTATSNTTQEKATGTSDAMYVVGNTKIVKLDLRGNVETEWTDTTYNGVAVDAAGQAYSVKKNVIYKLQTSGNDTSFFDLANNITDLRSVLPNGISINRVKNVLYFMGTGTDQNKYLYGVNLSNTSTYNRVSLDAQSNYNLSGDSNVSDNFLYIPCSTNCRGLIRVKLTSGGLPDPNYQGTHVGDTRTSILPFDTIITNGQVQYTSGFGMSGINHPQSAIVDTVFYPQPDPGKIRVFLTDTGSSMMILEFGENDPCIKDKSKCEAQYCPAGSDLGSSITYTNISASCCNSGKAWNGSSCVTPPPTTCNNGATNPPSCDTCPSGKIYYGNSCVNQCTNGATNPPSCNTCPSGKIYYGNSCVDPCSNGATNPTSCNTCPSGQTYNGGSCVENTCNNSATNPPDCNTCPTGYSYSGSSCVQSTCPSPQVLIGSTCIDISNSCSAIVSCAGGVAPKFDTTTGLCACSSSCRGATVRTRQVSP